MLDGRSEIGEGLSTEWLSRPAVTICPEWAQWARGALGVVDAFLVGAANDAIDQDPDRERVVCFRSVNGVAVPTSGHDLPRMGTVGTRCPRGSRCLPRGGSQ